MKCSKCGYDNHSRETTCRICGATLRGSRSIPTHTPNDTPSQPINHNHTNNYSDRNNYEPTDQNSNGKKDDDNIWAGILCGCCCIAILIFFMTGGISSDNSDSSVSTYPSSSYSIYDNDYASQSDANYSEGSNSSGYSDSSDNVARPSGVPSSARKVVIEDITHREDNFMDYEYNLVQEGAVGEIIGLYEADYTAIVNATGSYYPVGETVYLELSRDNVDSTSTVTYYTVKHVYSADGRKVL